MSESPARESGLLTPTKIAVELVGFVIGLALLAWCIAGAIEKGGWERLAHADAGLVAAMLACSLLSALINGAMFWVTIRPLKRLGFWDLQWLNFVGNLLNYAPVRLGAIARVVYHLRVDRLNLLQIGGWFTFIGYILCLGIGSCLLATLARDRLDWIWVALVLGQMALGGVLTRVVVGNRLLAKYGQGVDRIIAHPGAIWGAIGLRLADLAAYSGRMAIAMTILGISLPATHVIILALVALAASLIPFGRLGFREFCVAITAQRLSMLAADVEANMQQLALVESAGEALIFIPLGAVALLWYRKRWRADRRDRAEAQNAPS
ncbi:MAG: lysylphosphatidylglycerol synthase domain-containing protein [Planctomycetota bacterium]|nr:lysylphosphatidylglycerol synthase domain-containing protein [Planctomycetota bacterium]